MGPARLTGSGRLIERLVGCRKENITDVTSGIGVFPAEWFGVGRVSADIALEFAGQIGYRRKDTAGDHVAFDPCEPDFDLIEPGRVSGREVQMDVGVIGKEVLHQLGLVGREVIQNDVDLFSGRAAGNDFA